MADTAYWYCYLNTPSDQQVTSFILHQFEALWDKYDAAALGGGDGVDDAIDDGLIGCCRNSNGVDKFVVKGDNKDADKGGDKGEDEGEDESENAISGNGEAGGGQGGGNVIHGWTDDVFRDDKLLQLVKMRRHGQGSGQRQGLGQGQGQGQGQVHDERQGPGGNSGAGDSSVPDGINNNVNDGGASRSAAKRRLLYLSDDVLEISYRDLVSHVYINLLLSLVSSFSPFLRPSFLSSNFPSLPISFSHFLIPLFSPFLPPSFQVSDPYHTLSSVYDHIQVPWTDQQETHYQQQVPLQTYPHLSPLSFSPPTFLHALAHPHPTTLLPPTCTHTLTLTRTHNIIVFQVTD